MKVNNLFLAKNLKWWLALLFGGLIAGFLPALIWPSISQLPRWQALPAGQQVLCIGKQSALVVAVYGFKPLYMLIALGVLVFSWREPGIAWQALNASIISFWMGEFFCWLNILFFNDGALIFEYLHSLLMVFCLGFLFFSLVQVSDKDFLHFSDPHARCAFVGICKNCSKNQPAFRRSCVLYRLFKWMIPMAALVALIPLMAQPNNYSFIVNVFGYSRTLNHLMPIQWFELHFSPLASLVLVIVSWAALIWPSNQPGMDHNGLMLSKVFLSASIGFLSFSMMRLIFASFYRQLLVWFVFWEELTELMLIAGILIVVLLIRSERVNHLKLRLKEYFT
jgi:hypothetical protein